MNSWNLIGKRVFAELGSLYPCRMLQKSLFARSGVEGGVFGLVGPAGCRFSQVCPK